MFCCCLSFLIQKVCHLLLHCFTDIWELNSSFRLASCLKFCTRARSSSERSLQMFSLRRAAEALTTETSRHVCLAYDDDEKNVTSSNQFFWLSALLLTLEVRQWNVIATYHFKAKDLSRWNCKYVAWIVSFAVRFDVHTCEQVLC